MLAYLRAYTPGRVVGYAPGFSNIKIFFRRMTLKNEDGLNWRLKEPRIQATEEAGGEVGVKTAQSEIYDQWKYS